MLLVFRTLSGRQFQIDVEETKTVAEVKTILREQFDVNADSIKLLYSGKIIADDATVSTIPFKPNTFIVVHTTTKKVARPTTQAATPTTEAKPEAEAPKPATEAPVPSPTPASPPTTGRRPPIPIPDPQLYEEHLNSLLALGFSEDLAVRALVSAFNNIERAAELLYSNNVPELPQQSQAPAGNIPSGPRSTISVPNNAFQQTTQLVSQMPESEIVYLQQQLRQTIRNDPNATVNMIFNILSHVKPELAEQVKANPIPFFALLGMKATNTPHGVHIDPRSLNRPGEAPVTPVAQGARQVEGESLPGGPNLSEEDRAAIQQLIELTGSEEVMAIQAYLACDRNIDAAANFLLSQN